MGPHQEVIHRPHLEHHHRVLLGVHRRLCRHHLNQMRRMVMMEISERNRSKRSKNSEMLKEKRRLMQFDTEKKKGNCNVRNEKKNKKKRNQDKFTGKRKSNLQKRSLRQSLEETSQVVVLQVFCSVVFQLLLKLTQLIFLTKLTLCMKFLVDGGMLYHLGPQLTLIIRKFWWCNRNSKALREYKLREVKL